MPLDKDLDALTKACDQMAMPVWIADAQAPDCPVIYANPLFHDQAGGTRIAQRGKCCFYSEGAKSNALPESCVACRSHGSFTTCRPGVRKDGSRVLSLLTVRPLYVRHARVLVAGFQHDCRESATRIGFDQFAKKLSGLLQDFEGKRGCRRRSTDDIDSVRLNVMLMRFRSAHTRLQNVLLRARFLPRPNTVRSAAPYDAAQTNLGAPADCYAVEKADAL